MLFDVTLAYVIARFTVPEAEIDRAITRTGVNVVEPLPVEDAVAVCTTAI
jgi:hypothetical protein